tara:strand:- start:292 stop:882 length:591 start_codon:yes stop_codon:yes gene_type:complete
MGNKLALSTQHENFVTEYLYGTNKGNAAKSYANVYCGGELTTSCYSAASKLLSRDDVKGFLSIKMEEAADIAKYRKIHNSEVLSAIIDEMATTDSGNDVNGNPQSNHLQRNIAISAIREQNKMLGLNDEKVDLTVNGGMSFVFNLHEPSSEDELDIESEMMDIRVEKGDLEAEDVAFEEVDEENKVSRRERRNANK